MTNLSHFPFSSGPESREPTIHSLQVDLPGGWVRHSATDRQAVWFHGNGDALTQNFFSHGPRFPAPIDDIDAIRDHYRRKLKKFHGGIVEIETQDVGGLAAVRMVFKFVKDDGALSYIAGFAWGRRDVSYALKVECHLRGENTRDATLANRLAADGLIDPLTREGWRQDPYDPNIDGPVLCNMGEDPEFDEQFPDHPLARARRHLAELIPRVSFASSVLNAPPFTGPSD